MESILLGWGNEPTIFSLLGARHRVPWQLMCRAIGLIRERERREPPLSFYCAEPRLRAVFLGEGIEPTTFCSCPAGTGCHGNIGNKLTCLYGSTVLSLGL